jgi:excisionase family DNA binding protein
MRFVRDNDYGLEIPVMMTVEETYKAFKLSRQFIYGLVKLGKIKAIKSGNRFLINAQSLCDYLNSSTIVEEKPLAVNGIRPQS